MSTDCSKQGHLRRQMTLFGVLPSLVLRSSEDRDCTTSLGDLFHCLIMLKVIKLSFIASVVGAYLYLLKTNIILPIERITTFLVT